jgi:hypothetical protein
MRYRPAIRYLALTLLTTLGISCFRAGIGGVKHFGRIGPPEKNVLRYI